jgi:hypothetical protein
MSFVVFVFPAKAVFVPALQFAPRILIVIPTSLALLPVRLPGIMRSWGAALPPNIVLKVFVSSSVGVQAQQLVASLGLSVDLVAIGTNEPPCNSYANTPLLAVFCMTHSLALSQFV